MKTEKQNKTQKIAELERKLKEAEASQIHRLHFASQNLKKASTEKLMGSGVILEMTFLGGKPVFDPVMVANGLSKETIAAIAKDLKRSFEYSTELKPVVQEELK